MDNPEDLQMSDKSVHISRSDWVSIFFMIMLFISVGFVVPHLKATTFICSVPDIPTDPPHCPSYCDDICGGPRDIPECQTPLCINDCKLTWYWMCILK